MATKPAKYTVCEQCNKKKLRITSKTEEEISYKCDGCGEKYRELIPKAIAVEAAPIVEGRQYSNEQLKAMSDARKKSEYTDITDLPKRDQKSFYEHMLSWRPSFRSKQPLSGFDTTISKDNPEILIPLVTAQERIDQDIRVEWLIKDFLDKGGMAALHGPPGVKKSYWLQNLGICLALKQAFMGKYEVVKDCRVFIYQQELTPAEVKERLVFMKYKYPELRDTLFVNEQYGLMLDKEEGRKRLFNTIEQYELDVVILDPIYMLHSGNFKEERDMMQMLNPLKIYALTHGTTFIFGTHGIKGAQDRTGTRHVDQGLSGIGGTASFGQIFSWAWSLDLAFATQDFGTLYYNKRRNLPPRTKGEKIVFEPSTRTFRAIDAKALTVHEKRAYRILNEFGYGLNSTRVCEVLVKLGEVNTRTQGMEAWKIYQQFREEQEELLGGQL